ncbi:putative signal transduction histidine-protein kinase [Cercophora samala]|uniref:Signal transduction histidine-protein kinase n=1 Tax=Cercophora samala TaxID=330535 RepID=A0AA39ZJT6_9PEZI|nr:putative signal transduction histidine-protein kinase [Cercophora samala]
MHGSTGSGGNASAHPDLGLLFDLSPLPSLLLSPSWRITRASARFLDEWHLSADACVGLELLPFVQNQLSPSPVHLKFLTTAIDDAIAGRTERTSMPINTRRSVSWRARVIPYFKGDELLAIVLEWEEGPMSQLNLFTHEEVQPGLSTDEAFRILVQAVKDYAIFLLDTTGHIATWNTGAELLKGYRRDEIVGKHFSVFYGKEDLDIKKPEMELEICMRDGRVEDEGWRYRKDGSRFWANVVITAVYKDGVHVGFGKVTRDLTERKSAESRLIAAYEESEKLKSDFLANMSHEIRTPMHGMLSACALLLDTTLSPRQRDIVGIMDESGQVLLQVINDILDYSKLVSGSFSIHSDIVGITSIVTSVVRSVQTTLPPSVHFELFLATDLPRSVQGDPLRYRQILHNIVGNAAKFTEKGSIRVRAGVQREDHDSYIVMTEVTDTGIGIPEAAAAGLFTPFTQFDATTTKQYKGTGLGLSIAKSLAELMGGSIGYRPNPERHGSIFWFTARFKKIKSLEQIQDWKSKLVRKGDAILAMPEADVVRLRQELAEVAPIKSLLLVEDNVINQKVMLGLLRSLGFKNIALASNGSEAVNMVRSKPAAYDIVLMDISMPIMDGHQASRAIRDAGIRVPIVAMTAYALKGDRERCLEHGMNDYIPKPVDKKYLIKVLTKWILHEKDYRKAFDEQMNKLRSYESLTLGPRGHVADRLQQLSLVVQGEGEISKVSQSSDDTVNVAKTTSEGEHQQHTSSVVSSPRFEPLLPPVQLEVLDSIPDTDGPTTGDIVITPAQVAQPSVEAADSGGDTGTSTSGTTATTPLEPPLNLEKGTADVTYERMPSLLP